MHNVDTLIIGGGISGAATLHWLSSAGIDVVLIEAGERLGGVIGSRRNALGALVESGPNSVQLSQPLLVRLIDELELQSDLLFADGRAAKRFIVRDGSLVPVPMGPGTLISTRLFSVRAKLRLLREPFIRRGNDGADESIADFAARRFGREIADYAFNPFVSGVYAGRPEDLSMRSTFPKIYELERNHGSVIRGGIATMRAKRAARALPSATASLPRKGLISFGEGMATLPLRVQDVWSDRVRLGEAAVHIERATGGWHVRTADESFNCARVVIATSAHMAASLTETLDDELARTLRRIMYPPIASVVSVHRRDSVGNPLDGFGFLVPAVEQRKILGVVFSSTLFPNRAPEGHVALTTFVGGARQPELVGLGDRELQDLVDDEHRSLIGTTEAPVTTDITRWREAIPQYNLGYSDILASIDAAEGRHRGLYLAGNYRGGASVGDCVRSAFELSERIRLGNSDED